MKINEVHILMLGAEDVGKSALTVRFLTRRFIGDYISEGDCVYTHKVELGEDEYRVLMLDTCYKNGNPRNLPDQIRWADVVALVYDVSSVPSFDVVREFLQQLNRKPSTSLPTVVLANKIDLHPRAHIVDPQKAKQLAEEHGCHFFEVSATDDWRGVSRAFESVIRLAEVKEKRRSPLVLRRRRGSVTRQMAHKVMQVVRWSPKRS